MPTAISLFTGCGGSDFGLIAAGFDIVFANDIAKYARDFYLANLPTTDYVLSDVENLSSFPSADLVVGCYPCQGFSVGGVRKADRGINFLYREFERALKLVRPKAFIVENVDGMVRRSHRHLLMNQIVRFRLAGYRVKFQLLDARNYGVPQERTRLFLVGVRSDIEAVYRFPTPTHSFQEHDQLPACPTIGDAIGDLPEWPADEEYDRQPFHWYYFSRDRWRPWHGTARTVVAVSRHTGLHPVSPPLERVHTDQWRFKWEGPARRFSYRENSRLQGFPNKLVFPDSQGLRSKYRIIGNAVPPPLFEAVARALPNIW